MQIQINLRIKDLDEHWRKYVGPFPITDGAISLQTLYILYAQYKDKHK